MSHLMKGKVYGLSLPKAKAPVTGQPSRVAPLANSLMNKKASIFNQSDSDSDNSGKAQNASYRVLIRVADPHYANADLDPSFHFRADPDPTYYFNALSGSCPSSKLWNLRPLVYKSSKVVL
jgi:hypothetical protein